MRVKETRDNLVVKIEMEPMSKTLEKVRKLKAGFCIVQEPAFFSVYSRGSILNIYTFEYVLFS